MKGMPLFNTMIALLLAVSSAFAQPTHERLLFSHPLNSSSSKDGIVLQNTSGVFTDQGWQSTNASSQLFITLPEGLPLEGTFTVNVSNFDPYTQNINLKQPIIDLYSQPCGNKDIYETDGAWFHLISGTGYLSGVPGEAGFKLWAAPRGVGSKHEDRVMQDTRWDINHTYEFKFVWSGSRLYFFVDGQLKKDLPYSGQIEPFRYIFLGKDNLIWGYTAQPGPIFSNMRCYGPGDAIVDNTPPVLESVTPVTQTQVLARFDEVLNAQSANLAGHYSISPDLAIHMAQLQTDQKSVLLSTDAHSESITYTLTASAIADTADPPNVLDQASLSYTWQDLPVSGISRSNYRLIRRSEGDSVYSDRPFVFTRIPSELSTYYWIQTANDDKYRANADFLSFYASEALHLIVAYDVSMTDIPSWLADWQQTNLIIETDDTNFQCYTKNVDAGQITLGGNEQSTSGSMYLILLQSQQDTGDRTPPAPPTGVTAEKLSE